VHDRESRLWKQQRLKIHRLIPYALTELAK
jgi:hypothetical protein